MLCSAILFLLLLSFWQYNGYLWELLLEQLVCKGAILFSCLWKKQNEKIYCPFFWVCYCKRKKNDVNNKYKKILSSMESLGEPTDQNLKNGRNMQVVNNRAFALRLWWAVVLETLLRFKVPRTSQLKWAWIYVYEYAILRKKIFYVALSKYNIYLWKVSFPYGKWNMKVIKMAPMQRFVTYL